MNTVIGKPDFQHLYYAYIINKHINREKIGVREHRAFMINSCAVALLCTSLKCNTEIHDSKNFFEQ